MGGWLREACAMLILWETVMNWGHCWCLILFIQGESMMVKQCGITYLVHTNRILLVVQTLGKWDISTVSLYSYSPLFVLEFLQYVELDGMRMNCIDKSVHMATTHFPLGWSKLYIHLLHYSLLLILVIACTPFWQLYINCSTIFTLSSIFSIDFPPKSWYEPVWKRFIVGYLRS